MKLANYCWCSQEGLIYRFNQIRSYKWLNSIDWNHVKENLEPVKHLKLKYEQPIGDSTQWYAYRRVDKKVLCLMGIVDAYDLTSLWEFKCVKELTLEHRLQLLFYALMVKVLPLPEMVEWDEINFCLLNVRTGQQFKLKNDYGAIEKIALRIIDHRTVTMTPSAEDLARNVGPFVKNRSTILDRKPKAVSLDQPITLDLQKLRNSKGRSGYTVKELKKFCISYNLKLTGSEIKEEIAKLLLSKLTPK